MGMPVTVAHRYKAVIMPQSVLFLGGFEIRLYLCASSAELHFLYGMQFIAFYIKSSVRLLKFYRTSSDVSVI